MVKRNSELDEKVYNRYIENCVDRLKWLAPLIAISQIIMALFDYNGGFFSQNDMNYLNLIAQMHHERYDGHGYPDGLAGEEIPEIARIIAVSDAYDAMTSNRSYREVMDQKAVYEQIKTNAGKQFDPKIAEIMLEMIRND